MNIVSGAEGTLAVQFTTLNDVDGRRIGPVGGLVRTCPLMPSMDFAGTVEAFSNDGYAPDDKLEWEISTAALTDVAQQRGEILKGQITSRIVKEIHA
ncbi:hypothetical protein [Antarctobacter heliothermus]|uniref:hypothetical protein n=1 Tax=Antarctobacter heliothermus TaxID=74033 RepID=UPI0012FE5DBC|nr:hypothetical protein [Antarctobacter heliothermus]